MPVATGPLDRSRDFNWFALLLAGLATLLCLRLAALYANATDLFFDEAQYWAWSVDPALGYFSKPPLIAWIIGAATTACGAGEACVRLPSPLLHTATALAVFWLGSRLYDARIGALSALAFATLPGVSLSAGIISTDVPLLLCWALALVGFTALPTTDKLWPALLLGVALGAGLNAKYAMVWFIVCAGVYFFFAPERRALLRDWRLYLALAIGVAMIVPNLVWNYTNSFATFSHTADNANWGGSLLHPNKALEFFGAQFGVFGPILFGALLVIAWRARKGIGDPDRLLLAFSLPIIAVILAQALLSRAHANWAAPAYVAASVLVVASMVRDGAWGWLKASFAISAVVLALLIFGTATAGRLPLPLKPDPFARTLGWREVAEATRAELARAAADGKPFAAVLSDDRAMTAELLYYLRDEPTPILAWRVGAPHDHFEMTRPFTASTPAPVLLVRAGEEEAGPAAASFASVEKIADRVLPAGSNAQRRVSFFALAGYKGE